MNAIKGMNAMFNWRFEALLTKDYSRLNQRMVGWVGLPRAVKDRVIQWYRAGPCVSWESAKCAFYGLSSRPEAVSCCSLIFIRPFSMPSCIRSWWPARRLTQQGIDVSETQMAYTTTSYDDE